ncbi:MAG: hypothetical protein BWX64_00745 [Acidobacteria bacterium ADurb.Bin051]|jgi:hypothetical protein|nr:MAG: hypothetical protein BWX64_00745 [Acidobacteria bacterium ADurb.Bin051]
MTQASWPATTYAELAEIIRRNETAGDAARRFARGGRLIPDSILAARITDAIKRGKIPPRPPEYARIKAERMAARRERKKKAAAQKSRKPDAVTFDSPTTATAFLKSLVARGYQRELARPLQPGQFDVLHNAGVSIQILFVERASDDRWAARELSA